MWNVQSRTSPRTRVRRAPPTGRAKGPWAEKLAADHLERAGWRILERNFRFGRNEIDLIAERCGVIAFVEVKSRSGNDFGDPLEAIGRHKQVAIERAAAGWVEENPDRGESFRFDAICVETERARGWRPLLRHVEAAWGI